MKKLFSFLLSTLLSVSMAMAVFVDGTEVPQSSVAMTVESQGVGDVIAISGDAEGGTVTNLTRVAIGTGAGSGALDVLGDAAFVGPDNSLQVDGEGDLYVDNELEVRGPIHAHGGILGDASTMTNWLVAASTPATNSPGTAGSMAYDMNYLYVCVSNALWRRVALPAW